MKLNLDAIKLGLEQKSTYELTEILKFSQDDYQPPVITIIENILTERGITREELNEYTNSFNKLKNGIDKSNFRFKTPAIVTIIAVAFGSYVYRTVTENAFKTQPKEVIVQTWTDIYTDSIKNALVTSTGFKSMPEKYKVPFCDCYINKLKTLYPNRLTDKLNGAVVDTLISQCADKVKSEIK